MTDDESFKDKLRSLNFRSSKAAPKKVVHHTDTAIVTETHRDGGQDTNVQMLKPAKFLKRQAPETKDS